VNGIKYDKPTAMSFCAPARAKSWRRLCARDHGATLACVAADETVDVGPFCGVHVAQTPVLIRFIIHTAMRVTVTRSELLQNTAAGN